MLKIEQNFSIVNYKQEVTMKIGIISDTHCWEYTYIIPDWIKKAFKDVDMIVHAGDVETPSVLNSLQNIAPVYAVRGNCDSSGLNTPDSISLDIGCGKLTAAHKPAQAHYEALSSPNTRVIVFGHTHIATISEENGILLINPGSPSHPRGGLPPSVAILEVNNRGELFPQIITKY